MANDKHWQQIKRQAVTANQNPCCSFTSRRLSTKNFLSSTGKYHITSKTQTHLHTITRVWACTQSRAATHAYSQGVLGAGYSQSPLGRTTFSRYLEETDLYMNWQLLEISSNIYVLKHCWVYFPDFFFFTITLQMVDKIKIVKWIKKTEQALQWSVRSSKWRWMYFSFLKGKY